MNVKELKQDMKSYAETNKLTIPDVSWNSDTWGAEAKKLAWRVSSHMKMTATTSKVKLWAAFHPKAPAAPKAKPKPKPAAGLEVLRPSYKWNGAPVKRNGSPPGIVWHHAAGTGSPEQIHRVHLAIGDRGIAYHFYVRLNGKVYAGRPENTMGAHCLGHNDWLGVCAEGNYETNGAIMPAAQLKALQALHAMLHKKYGGIPDRPHKSMSGNSTACPGRAYPFDKITSSR